MTQTSSRSFEAFAQPLKKRGATWFYAFVEDAGEVEGEAIYGPDDRQIDRSQLGGEAEQYRVRLGAIRRSVFRSRMAGIRKLDHTAITEAQRVARLHELQDFFRETRLPILDLYLKTGDLPDIDRPRVFAPSGWLEVCVGSRTESEAPLVYVGAPEFRRGGYYPGVLKRLQAVDELHWGRLRDIFSLAHISDRPFGEAEGRPEPGPDLGGDRPGYDWDWDDPDDTPLDEFPVF